MENRVDMLYLNRIPRAIGTIHPIAPSLTIRCYRIHKSATIILKTIHWQARISLSEPGGPKIRHFQIPLPKRRSLFP